MFATWTGLSRGCFRGVEKIGAGGRRDWVTIGDARGIIGTTSDFVVSWRSIMQFKNREHAAYLLVERLRASYKNKNPLVLGIPRGAVPMAQIIADGLGGELDVVLVRKLSHPDQPEFAIGAIDETGHACLAEWAADIDPQFVEAEKQRQLAVLRERRARY